MSREEFTLRIFNKDYDGYVIKFSNESAWIWVGEKRLDVLNLCHYPLSSMLFDGANTQREFFKAINMRIAKQIGVGQVFFSSDLENEGPDFWKELYTVLVPHLVRIMETQ